MTAVLRSRRRGVRMSAESFHELIRRVREGDDDAAARLVNLYEADVRRVVRHRLLHSPLRQLLDSVDIWQSVLANFFVRVASGQFELDTPEQLRKLLTTMACNRLNDQARRQSAKRRGEGQVHADGAEALNACADPAASPSQVVAMRELLARVQGLLTPEERLLVERRSEGHDWAAIAAELGKSPEALRKQFSRALDRVARQVGLEGVEEA